MKEEITRLNVEVARLNTWIVDEEGEFEQHILRFHKTEPFLCEELQEHCNHRIRLNNIHRGKLGKLFQLAGFTDSTQISSRVHLSEGLTICIPATVPLQACANGEVQNDDPLEEEEDESEDDQDRDEMTRLEAYVESIPMHNVAP
jgi:hypothetical protein